MSERSWLVQNLLPGRIVVGWLSKSSGCVKLLSNNNPKEMKCQLRTRESDARAVSAKRMSEKCHKVFQSERSHWHVIVKFLWAERLRRNFLFSFLVWSGMAV